MAGGGDGGFCLKKPKAAAHKHNGTSTHGQSTRTEKRVFSKKPMGRNGALNLLSSSAP
jgi:hypothetical protein